MLKAIVKRIKKVRGSMSQKMFADKIGVEYHRLKMVESFKEDPPPELINAICENFPVSVRWLLLGDLPNSQNIFIGGVFTNVRIGYEGITITSFPTHIKGLYFKHKRYK